MSRVPRDYMPLTHYVTRGLSRKFLLGEIEARRLPAICTRTASDGRRYYKIARDAFAQWELERAKNNGRPYGVLHSKRVTAPPVGTCRAPRITSPARTIDEILAPYLPRA